jgi:hypothetical protein
VKTYCGHILWKTLFDSVVYRHQKLGRTIDNVHKRKYVFKETGVQGFLSMFAELFVVTVSATQGIGILMVCRICTVWLFRGQLWLGFALG